MNKINELLKLIKITMKPSFDRVNELHKFHKELIESIPPDICKAIGTIQVGVGVELTVADYIWWKNQIRKEEFIPIISLDEFKSKLMIKLENILGKSLTDSSDQKVVNQIMAFLDDE